jgi:CRP/FNR family transcriptional regulator
MNQTIRYFDQAMKMPQDWIQTIRNKEAVAIKTGELIYRQGEYAHSFYFLTKGQVQAFVTSPDGEEKKLARYGPGDLFGEASFFDGFPRISSAKALQDSMIVTLRQSDVLALFQAHPTFAFTLMQQLSKKVRMLSREIDDLTFLPAEKRIAQYLHQQYTLVKGPIQGTQEDIGSAVGVRRVTVSRILSAFSQKKWIAIGYRKIHILDPDALLKLYQEL